MTDSSYALALAAAAALSLAALVLSCARAGLGARRGALAAALAVPLCLVGARGYYLLMNNVLGGRILMGGLVSPYPYEHAMCGAVLGAMLAAVLAARLTGERSSRLLDALAPAGLLMIALARFAEVFSDFGWGQVIDDPALCFFPVAAQDMFGQWHGAVFVLEGLLALLVLVAALRRRGDVPGGRFAFALIAWSMAQIFCESLRAETLRWGFVRVQQVQCAVFALAALAVGSVKAGLRGRRLALPFAAYLLGVALVVGLEYALDKLPMPRALDYAVMALVLAAMGGAAHRPWGELSQRKG